MKFTFKGEHMDYQTEQVTSVVTLETEQVGLADVLTDMEAFLKGCGFHFTGNLEIVDEEDC